MPRGHFNIIVYFESGDYPKFEYLCLSRGIFILKKSKIQKSKRNSKKLYDPEFVPSMSYKRMIRSRIIIEELS